MKKKKSSDAPSGWFGSVRRVTGVAVSSAPPQTARAPASLRVARGPVAAVATLHAVRAKPAWRAT